MAEEKNIFAADSIITVEKLNEEGLYWINTNMYSVRMDENNGFMAREPVPIA